MKITVLGASGHFGSNLSEVLEGQGHTVVRASRSTGVDAVAGTGLREAFAGADAVVDALHINSFSARTSVPFFERAAGNTVGAAREEGVGRIVCLSIAGAADPRVNGGFGYYKGKAVQESIYQQSDVPSTTLRSTQWFDFVPSMTSLVVKGRVGVLPEMLMAPALREEVAEYMAELTTARHEAHTDIFCVRGPEAGTIADFARRILAAGGDLGGKKPSVIRTAPYLGRGIANGGLIPQGGHVTPTRFEDWLR
ncbi:SDR family oxidoreductase [Kocuria sp.]|uniref:SDR family oxidoreductase n=1 Tax=Kocuria sp. TaxID=1871328 RepID=UPI0026DAAC07|nr:SDR family oxidoreductase [Kocuria sp.]MDO4919049.1 SDR family oxidoreductase [Kocuria sp.]